MWEPTSLTSVVLLIAPELSILVFVALQKDVMLKAGKKGHFIVIESLKLAFQMERIGLTIYLLKVIKIA